ncbi:Transcription factor [Komagataella phaffii CBS 7435]|uniref:Subunit of the SAGA transcriptional regulatory complex but not present in SAGA-like complex SLIK/SAL n=2 Tax=Komagataella phaffii TaxID=460519 RepID=C4QY85_KOMPG|nr:Subunit of the SAGA transcriptional regulatory complex but not present in SAGA-like complex SLIK/SAL [Komagataella phaffii GS115]AOA61041.1 GQ67_01803T0 [Komagataella phaffii]CAH2447030.1 Transcription factor [Komagataella phaffii CBS 7435]AOA66130.1 GQ68_01818T0 [Komagataella phaffii GS115]CAY68208.1 Subunit of the SAGA transcriptional regulatory complex but not present in SAGA-like complex SLIK/SAL [Komagataella phaffii GS115]CCA37281.1 Transcription factor [Komagataella phaffii CBS 7435]
MTLSQGTTDNDTSSQEAPKESSPMDVDSSVKVSKEPSQEPSNEAFKNNGPTPSADSLASIRRSLRKSAFEAVNFDIAPYAAIPYSCAIHSIALTSGPRWLFTGGDDGFVRKFDFLASIEGKLPLTVAQKHSLVDSVTHAGVLNSYWENEQPVLQDELDLLPNTEVKRKEDNLGSYEPKINPVYSLAVQKDGLWLLSGLESGGISLQSAKYQEGSIVHYFPHGTKHNHKERHTTTVSCLTLNSSETGFLSGSWDNKVLQWDLNTGSCVTEYSPTTSQISTLHYRPITGCEINVDTPIEDNDDVDSLFGDSDDENVKTDFQNDLKDRDYQIVKSDHVFMTSSMDGSLNIWDARASASNVLRISVPPTTPPWAMSAVWSVSGDSIFVGRRNATVEEIDLKMPSKRSSNTNPVTNPIRTLRFPSVSGPVSCVRTLFNGRHVLCGSHDNIRLYDIRLHQEEAQASKKSRSKTPFLIIAGHHGGVISDMYIDPTFRFMISASGNRGWQGTSTETVMIYEISIK